MGFMTNDPCNGRLLLTLVTGVYTTVTELEVSCKMGHTTNPVGQCSPHPMTGWGEFSHTWVWDGCTRVHTGCGYTILALGLVAHSLHLVYAPWERIDTPWLHRGKHLLCLHARHQFHQQLPVQQYQRSSHFAASSRDMPFIFPFTSLWACPYHSMLSSTVVVIIYLL